MTEPHSLPNREACAIIENEGIAYAVCDYIGSEAFADLDTRILWAAAEHSLNALRKHLRDSGCDLDG